MRQAFRADAEKLQFMVDTLVAGGLFQLSLKRVNGTGHVDFLHLTACRADEVIMVVPCDDEEEIGGAFMQPETPDQTVFLEFHHQPVNGGGIALNLDFRRRRQVRQGGRFRAAGQFFNDEFQRPRSPSPPVPQVVDAMLNVVLDLFCRHQVRNTHAQSHRISTTFPSRKMGGMSLKQLSLNKGNVEGEGRGRGHGRFGRWDFPFHTDGGQGNSGFPQTHRQGVRRLVLGGAVNVDFGQPPCLERLPNGLAGQFRRIAIRTQMPQDDSFQLRVSDFGNQFAGLMIGQMPMLGADPLLGGKRPLGIVLEQRAIVVRLNKQRVQALQTVPNVSRHMSQIRQQTEAVVGRAENESHRIHGIMWHRKALNFDFPDAKFLATLDHFPRPLMGGFETFPHDLAGQGVAINWHGKFLRQHIQPPHMIPMFVREENRGDRVRVGADGLQPALQLACAQSRIHQNPGVAEGNEGAVAATAAAEHGKMHLKI